MPRPLTFIIRQLRPHSHISHTIAGDWIHLWKVWTLCVICCRMMGANLVECFPGDYCSAVSVSIVLREMSPVWPNNGPGGAVWCRNIWAMDKSTSSQTYCKKNRQCWTQESYLSKSKDVMLKYYFCKRERHKYMYQYPYYGSPDWIQ